MLSTLTWNFIFGGDIIYLFSEIIFYKGKRNSLPKNGYRPDIILDEIEGSYWGVTLTALNILNFEVADIVEMRFTFQEKHYDEISIGQTFKIMEGATQVGEGKILSIETE